MNTRDLGRRRATGATVGLAVVSVAGSLGVALLAQAASAPGSADDATQAVSEPIPVTPAPTAAAVAAASQARAGNTKPAKAKKHKKPGAGPTTSGVTLSGGTTAGVRSPAPTLVITSPSRTPKATTHGS